MSAEPTFAEQIKNWIESQPLELINFLWIYRKVPQQWCTIRQVENANSVIEEDRNSSIDAKSIWKERFATSAIDNIIPNLPKVSNVGINRDGSCHFFTPYSILVRKNPDMITKLSRVLAP